MSCVFLVFFFSSRTYTLSQRAARREYDRNPPVKSGDNRAQTIWSYVKRQLKDVPARPADGAAPDAAVKQFLQDLIAADSDAMSALVAQKEKAARKADALLEQQPAQGLYCCHVLTFLCLFACVICAFGMTLCICLGLCVTPPLHRARSILFVMFVVDWLCITSDLLRASVRIEAIAKPQSTNRYELQRSARSQTPQCNSADPQSRLRIQLQIRRADSALSSRSAELTPPGLIFASSAS